MDSNRVKLIAKEMRASALHALVQLNSQERGDYRYLQGMIHCIDKLVGKIDELEAIERGDDD